MGKLQEYIQKYKRLHDGTDPYYQYDSETKEWNLKPSDSERSKRHEMFSGAQFIRKFPPHLKDYIEQKQKKSISILDYGCGLAQWTWRNYGEYSRGVLGHMGDQIQSIWLYDPAVEPFSEKPPIDYRFDVVTCADVMEHVPEEHVDEVLADMAMYCKSDGRMILAISGNEAFKKFSDGENVHCTVKPIDWWEEKIAAHNREYVIIHADNRRQPIQQIAKGNIK